MSYLLLKNKNSEFIQMTTEEFNSSNHFDTYNIVKEFDTLWNMAVYMNSINCTNEEIYKLTKYIIDKKPEVKLDMLYLVLENVDTLKIPAEYIMHLNASNDKTEYNFFRKTERQIFDYISYGISKEILELPYINEYSEDFPEDAFETPEESLDRRDVTSLILTYTDGTKKILHLNYDEEKPTLGAPNKNMKIVPGELGIHFGIFRDSEEFQENFQRDISQSEMRKN